MNTVIRSATIVNEGRSFVADVLIKNDRIAKIAPNINVQGKALEIDAGGLLLKRWIVIFDRYPSIKDIYKYFPK